MIPVDGDWEPSRVGNTWPTNQNTKTQQHKNTKTQNHKNTTTQKHKKHTQKTSIIDMQPECVRGRRMDATVGNVGIVELVGARLVQQVAQAAVRKKIARIRLARLRAHTRFFGTKQKGRI